jgi:hypothetical protein
VRLRNQRQLRKKMTVDFELKRKVRSQEYSPAFEKLVQKIEDPCDLKVPLKPPSWLDKNLFYTGQEFFRGYYFSLFFSSIQNLLVGISIPNLWYVCIYFHKHVLYRFVIAAIPWY